MVLNPGSRLGPYEIIGPLGAGGMGEVFRARDTRLGREVAIKALPDEYAHDPARLARFEREAKTISSLNHPHICTLFDVGQEDGTAYLVMELVEGETLTQRLTRGPLRGAEVVQLGVQIAEALERAHGSGIVHRDLKPGNVMLTKSGAKLLDFGLARPAGLKPATGDITSTPTEAAPLTTDGTIVGTFQYMSPEQLEGKEADARSDLWALGCVLYEAATGKRAFEGATQASLVSAIMRDEPRPIAELVPLAPPGLERVVTACLAKDPAERLQSAHDAKLQLQWIAVGGSQAGVPVVAAARRRSRERYAWAVAVVFALLAAASLVPRLLQRPEAAKAAHVSVLPPEDAIIDDEMLHTAISADGRAIVFVATDSSGTSQLWVRDLASPSAQRLPGTEGAILPFWSPDSRFIGFFAGGQLKKVDVGGQNVQVLCEAPDGRGGAWGRSGVIVFAPASASPLEKVSQEGGKPVPVTRLDASRGDLAHRFPSFLPDGRHFLYVTLTPGISYPTRLGSLDSQATDSLLTADGAGIYAAPGYVIFSRNGALLAQRLDLRGRKVTGEPLVLGPAPRGLSLYTGAPDASVSANGVLVQRHRSPRRSRLVWLDRDGRAIGTVPTPPAEYDAPVLSPDGTRVAIGRTSPETIKDLWVVDLASGVATKLTTDRIYAENPVWSEDSQEILFSALEGGDRNLYSRQSSGAGGISLFATLKGPFNDPVSWSADGQDVFLRRLAPETGEDVWVLPIGGDRKPWPLLNSPYHEEDPSPSPDGHWLAYRSNESGRTELYVQSFPTPETRVRISTEGAGTSPRSSSGRAVWGAGGRELLYLSGDGVTMMSVPVSTSGTFHAGPPQALFKIPPDCNAIAPTADGRRFLILQEVSSKEATSIQVVLNWPAELKQK
jgi:Tol biopolymer transport system component